MSATGEPRPGRPRRSSREILQEAAVELFLEQGYPHTSVEQIASRAGVSRNTFFNYFAGKPDVLWAGLDDLLGDLADRLAHEPSSGGEPPAARVVRIIGLVLERPGAASLPLALTWPEAMAVGPEALDAGARRLGEAARIVQRHLGRAEAAADSLAPRAAAYAIVGCATAGALEWATAGVGRGPIGPYLERALAAAGAALD